MPLLPETGQIFRNFHRPFRIQIEQGGFVNDADPSGAASKNGIRGGDKIKATDGVPLRVALHINGQNPTAE